MKKNKPSVNWTLVVFYMIIAAIILFLLIAGREGTPIHNFRPR